MLLLLVQHYNPSVEWNEDAGRPPVFHLREANSLSQERTMFVPHMWKSSITPWLTRIHLDEGRGREDRKQLLSHKVLEDACRERASILEDRKRKKGFPP